MADTQADNAQGQAAPPPGTPAPAAPKNGEESKTVPLERFQEVVAERNAFREEMAQLRQSVAELQQRPSQPQPEPEEETDEDKRIVQLMQKANAPLTQTIIGLADELDRVKSAQVYAGASAEEVKAAEDIRVRLRRAGIPVNREDAYVYAMGLKAREERTKAATEEGARQRANRAAFTENAPGTPPPALPADFDRLSPEEQARHWEKSLGDTPIP